MRLTMIAIIALVSVPCLADEVHQATAPQAPEAKRSIVYRAGRAFYVPANFDVDEDILGRGFTRKLRNVDAEGKKIGRVYQTPVKTISTDAFKSSLEEVNDSMQLGFAASYFGFEASAKHHSSSRFALLTACHVAKVMKIDDSADPAPSSADLVATEVIYGWYLSYWFEGQASGSDFGVSLRVLSAGGGLNTAVAQGRIQMTFKSTGLKAKHSGKVPIVLKAEDILSEFVPDEVPQPILIKYVAVRDIKSSSLHGDDGAKACEGDACITDAWIERATAAVNGLVQRSGPEIAATIQQIGHPSGGSPTLRGAKVERSAHGIALKVSCDWVGSFDAANTTTVRWEIGPGGPLGIRLYDDATFSIADENRQQLAEYFDKTLYQAIAPDLQP